MGTKILGMLRSDTGLLCTVTEHYGTEYQPISVAPSDARPTCDQEVAPGRQHSFVEVDYELFSTVILSRWFKKGSCQFWRKKYTILINRLEDQVCPVKLWLGKLTALTWPQWVDWTVNPQHKQTKAAK